MTIVRPVFKNMKSIRFAASCWGTGRFLRRRRSPRKRVAIFRRPFITDDFLLHTNNTYLHRIRSENVPFPVFRVNRVFRLITITTITPHCEPIAKFRRESTIEMSFLHVTRDKFQKLPERRRRTINDRIHAQNPIRSARVNRRGRGKIRSIVRIPVGL